MKLIYRIWLVFKALSELGPAQVSFNALYHLGLYSGHYQRQLTASLARLDHLNHGFNLKLEPCLPDLPNQNALLSLLGDQTVKLYEQADEIVNGRIRLFSSRPVPLKLSLPEAPAYWTKYADGSDRIGDQDIKYIWEPARFGWACTLAMAYHLSKNELYCQAFWEYTDQFLTSNPPYIGPHWCSAQEVAIRLVALAFALQVFAQSNLASDSQLKKVAENIAIHAERIPPTLIYARSQNNNHLVMEALGLYTASALLPGHPFASRWHKLGWDWLQSAFRAQIEPDGMYTQHSTNYHRLMLQAALWAFAVHNHSFGTEAISRELRERLVSATRWLWKMVDPDTGRVPNLGHNDGSYILPLTASPYHDYRPVINAAARVFIQTNLLPKGPWEDMSLWLCSQDVPSDQAERINIWREPAAQQALASQSPHILLNQVNGSWAALRVAQFHSRPAHADQLHVDLWWHGLNLALDPGTYLYNSPAPWENSLTSACVHNTVTIDGQEFMHHAGRFLYLDWAQAKVIKVEESHGDTLVSITASHNGFRKLGIVHARKVTAFSDGHWEIIDQLTGSPYRLHTIHLHWLLPDWEYEIRETPEKTSFPGYTIRIRSPYGWVMLNMSASTPQAKDQPSQTVNLQLARAGTLLFGSGTIPSITGWTSPMYGVRMPALACILKLSQSLPVELKSEWILPNES